MKTWYSASELAGLPGMPTTKRGVNLAVSRSGWRTRENGMMREIAAASLPAATRRYLMGVSSANGEALIEVAPVVDETRSRQKAKEDGLRQFAALPDTDPRKARAAARQWLLSAWADFAQAHSTTPAGCVVDFIAQYRVGEIAVPEVHREALPIHNGVRSLDRATLYRWRKAYQERGVAGLMDGYGNRKGAFKVASNTALKEIVLGVMFAQPHITPSKIVQYLEAEHPGLGVVSEKAIERFVKHWKAENQQAWTSATNPDLWKNRFMAAFGSQHEGIVRLNQLWEMDSTPADWMLSDGRHCVIGVIDLYSRRLTFRVSKTSKAEAVCLAFRKAVMAWGVPEMVRTDNGADYKSQRFATVLRDLEIPQLLCVPFASEQKGTVERAMRTMSHGVLDLLPGFIGHNVAERQIIRARKSFAERIMTPGEVIEVSMSATDLQQALDQWCEHIYGRNEHRGLDNQTPWQIANAWRGPIRKISDERALDALLAEIAGQRSVTKKGIRYEHHEYIAAELVDFIGQDVHLRLDADDIGRLYVYDLNGQFICIAEAPEVTGISRAEVAAVSHAKQKDLRKTQRQESQDLARQIKKNPYAAIAEHRIAQSQNITALPRRAEEYSTPALREHGVAARSTDAPAATTDDRLQQELAQLEAEMQEAPKPAAVLQADDPQRRYERWRRLERRASNGEHLNENDRNFVASYPKSSEFKSMKSFFEDFGSELEAEA